MIVLRGYPKKYLVEHPFDRRFDVLPFWLKQNSCGPRWPFQFLAFVPRSLHLTAPGYLLQYAGDFGGAIGVELPE